MPMGNRVGFAAVERREATRLRLRDKALPDRLVIGSLVCDTIVILYAMVMSVFYALVINDLQSEGNRGGKPPDTALEQAQVLVAESPPAQLPASRRQLDLPALLGWGEHDSLWLSNLKVYAAHIAIGSLTLLFALTYLGVYERMALLRFRFVWPQLLRGSLSWVVGFFAFALLLEYSHPHSEALSISRLFVSAAAVLTPLSLLAWRWIFHRFLQRSSVAVNLRQRVLFVGWNEEAHRLTETFASDPVTAYEVVGCIGSMRARFQRKPQTRVLGQFQELVNIVHRYSVDMVILTDLNCVKGDVIGLANTCEREMVQFKIMPSYFQILVSGLHLETVSGIPILGVSRLPLDRAFNIFVKRLVDIFGAMVGLIIAAPLIAVFGAIVYGESPGPIFYRQRRLGRNGVEFDIIKIRSMKPDAESGGIPGWTTPDDPRRLRIGIFMRKWNIDELPQFWNVLKGEMSLVGPRPERPELISGLKHDIPHYNARHNCKPGISGLAQVRGLRGDTDLEARIKSDLYYLENWSLLLDIQILAMTLVRCYNASEDPACEPREQQDPATIVAARRSLPAPVPASDRASAQSHTGMEIRVPATAQE